MKRGLVIVGLAAVMACGGDATGPNAEPLYPDAIPVAWNHADSLLPYLWDEMSRCSGIAHKFRYRDITFFNIPRDNFPVDTITALGLWMPSRKHVYVARLNLLGGNSQVQRTTKHEILHVLLHPETGHPPEWFGPSGPCGSLMQNLHSPS